MCSIATALKFLAFEKIVKLGQHVCVGLRFEIASCRPKQMEGNQAQQSRPQNTQKTSHTTPVTRPPSCSHFFCVASYSAMTASNSGPLPHGCFPSFCIFCGVRAWADMHGRVQRTKH